ncbi:MAG: hypothetical protein R6X13_02965 [bacterium]
MVAIAGIVSITELRQLVGTGWIAFRGVVLREGRGRWRDVAPSDERLWIADIETSQEILHGFCDPVTDVLCRESGVKAMAHDWTFITIRTGDHTAYTVDIVTPFYLSWEMVPDQFDERARNRFRGIVLNKYDEALAHGAVDELNAAGLLKPFLDDAGVSSGD